VSATRISLMASSSSFICFFPAISWDPHRLPCLDYYVWFGTVSKTLYQWVWTSSIVTAKQI
jgi:hypothetical protein